MNAVLAILAIVMALPFLLVSLLLVGIALGPALLVILLVIAFAVPVFLLEAGVVEASRLRHRRH